MKPQIKTPMTKYITSAIVLIVVLYGLNFTSQIYAAPGINETINFQGKLVNSDGTNVTDGNYTIDFTLYDAASAGTNVWTEEQTVEVDNGIFRVALGSVVGFDADVFDNDNLYLGISINSGTELSPRIRFTASPYAMNAKKVNGLNVTNTNGTLTIPNGTTIAFSGSNNLTFTTTAATNITLPTTGTLATLAGAETLTNKTIGSTGLTFSGATTDITTVSNENLSIVPNGTGKVKIGTNLTSNSDNDARLVLFDSEHSDFEQVAQVDGTGYGYMNTAFTLYNPDATDPYAELFTFGSEGTYTDAGTLTGYDFYIYDNNRDEYNMYIEGINGNVGIGQGAWGSNFKLEVAGHVGPLTDSSYDLGSSSIRWRNGYFDTLYGDGSNLTGISASSIADDSLDFTKFEDTLDLDAALTLNQTTNTWSQTFTGTTTTGLTYTASSLTSGSAVNVTSAATAMTGSLLNVTLTGSNASNTGSVLRASSAATSAVTVGMFTNLGTGYSLRVNDETGDADITPFVIDASGNTLIGTTTQSGSAKLTVSGNTFSSSGFGLNGGQSIQADANNGYTVDALNANIRTGGNLYVSLDANNDSTSNFFAIQNNSAAAGSGTQLFRVYEDGNVGIGTGTSSPGARLHALSTTEQLRLGYDTSNYSSFTVSSGGDLTIAPSGGDAAVTGTIDVSGHGAFGSGASVSTDNILTLAETMNPSSNTLSGLNSIVSSDTAFASGGLYGGIIRAQSTATTGTLNWINGAQIDARSNAAGTVSNLIGIYGGIQNSSSGTIATGNGAKLYVINAGTGTITTAKAINIDSATNSGGGTITTNYGMHINTQTVGSADYGARIDAADTQTLWISGNADNTAASAGIAFGSSRDTNLYRSAANTLSTDDSFTVGADLTVNAQGDIRFADSDSSHYAAIQAPGTITTSYTLTMPTAVAGGDDYALVGNASGVLSWVDTSTFGGGGSGSFTDITTGTNSTATMTLASGSAFNLNTGVTMTFDSGSTLDVNGDLAIADTDIALDGTSANFNATGNVSFNTDDLIIEKSSGYVGINTTNPGSWLEINADSSSPGGFVAGTSLSGIYSGSSGSYNSYALMYASATTEVTGAGLSEAFAFYNDSFTGNDATAQNIYGNYSQVTTHANDTGYAFYAKSRSQGTSTAGTQYGLYINMNDPDVTSYGIYQDYASSLNYFEGSVGIGDETPDSPLEVLSGSGNPQMRLSYADGTDFTLYTNASGDVTLDASGNDVLINDKLTVLSTTEQLRLSYDASNYFSFTTSSSGGLTVSSSGSTGLIFSGDTVDITTASNENLTVTAAGTGDVVFSTDADTGVQITAAAAPGVDILGISNAGQGTTTHGADGLDIAFTQGDDSDNTDFNAGLTITMTSSSGDADILAGINISDITPGAASEYGLVIGTGWDAGLVSNSSVFFTAGLTSEATTVIGASGNTFTFNPASGPSYAGTARPTKTISLNPEYPGAVLTAFYGAGTDSSLTGSMTSDTDTSSNLLRNYYSWTSTVASLNYYTVAVRVRLPKDFSAWATSNAVQIDYATQSTSASNNVVDVYIYNGDDTPGTAVASSTSNVSSLANTWGTITIDDSTLDDASAPEWDAPDETAVIYIRVGSQSSNVVKIGDIRLNYLSSF